MSLQIRASMHTSHLSAYVVDNLARHILPDRYLQDLVTIRPSNGIQLKEYLTSFSMPSTHKCSDLPSRRHGGIFDGPLSYFLAPEAYLIRKAVPLNARLKVSNHYVHKEDLVSSSRQLRVKVKKSESN